VSNILPSSLGPLLRKGGRLALGTAQFGLDYGIANQVGQISPTAAKTILEFASLHKIDTLDTAIAYGKSEAVLGEIGVMGWRVITKLPPLPETIEDCESWVQDQVSGSLNRLRVSKLDSVLLHRPQDLFGSKGPSYLQALNQLKETGMAEDVGVSVYRPEELDAIWQVFRPDLVQAPFNVFDRRFQTSGWLSRLADEGVRIHTRSAFLQGLLLMPAKQRPEYFRPWDELLNEWQSWSGRMGMSALAAALSFCLNCSHIERVIVGVDSLQQLEEILNAANAPAVSLPDALCSQDRTLIEPSQWKL
jgi:aryl-alcohol dehydrogenase-like predicted oxidoreductase